MKKIYVLAMAILLASCATNQNTAGESTAQNDTTTQTQARTPSAAGDLTGDYLGEGLFSGRTTGLRRPAMRIYLNRAPGEADSYYGVVLEYSQLLQMGLPYLASQKAPFLNNVIGYLNNIASHISAYKFVPSQTAGTYELHPLFVQNGQLVPTPGFQMTLVLNPKNTDSKNLLAGAVINGNKDGQIVVPTDDAPTGVLSGIADALSMSQFKLAQVVYKKGHLASTWRGNWKDLEGSYLSEYGRFKDGVLELYSDTTQKMKFTKTNTTQAKYFTNPKSATIEGHYIVSEPVPKMYILAPAKGTHTASDVEMGARIGLFLDVFDGSAPEAGSHLVTELAFTNPQDPEDFMMYYEHPQHLKNVGVEPAKK